MKLNAKIVIPSVLIMFVFLGVFAYLLFSINEQGRFLKSTSETIEKTAIFSTQLNALQEKTARSLLSYRFVQDQEYLDTIVKADLETSRIVDRLSGVTLPGKGQELLRVFVVSREGIDSAQAVLLDAIDDSVDDLSFLDNGVTEAFERWNILSEKSIAALEDLVVFNTRELNRSIEIIEIQRQSFRKILLFTVIVSLSLVILSIFFYRKIVVKPIEELTVAAKETSEQVGGFKLSIDQNVLNSQNEIGVLARSFKTMTEDLQAAKRGLQNKVRERTEELNSQLSKSEAQNKELENIKKATLNVLEDVEIEKRRAENLANDLKKFKQAVDNTSDMIVITDVDGIVLYGNKAVETLTGYSAEEAVGKKAAALWKTPMPQLFYEKLWNTIKVRKKPFNAQVQNKRKDGSIYDAQISIAPVLDDRDEITFFVGIERDITREKEIDRAKTEFVSLASHQLRTPLSTIAWYAEMLLSGDAGKLSKDQQQYLEEVYKGNRRMVDLVNALLNVSRLELGTFMVEPEDVQITDLAEDAVKELVSLTEERNVKIVESYDDVPILKLDRKLTYIIFQNLLSNAVKYSKEGGKVEISIEKNKRFVLIKVSDDGMGIPKNQQNKIFSKLFRADNVKETDTTGTGLGLYIVRSILDHSGGSISFESEEGKGTTFYVKIPMKGMEHKDGSKKLS